MITYQFHNKVPRFAPTARAAQTAVVAGEVTIGERVGLWHGAVLRGDHTSITVGDGSNVQDNAVVHVGVGYPTAIGKNVTIGHGCIIHGCMVEDDCVIGMGSILLNGCVIGEGCLVAAGSLVTQGKVIPPHSLVMGSPAKVIRALTAEELQGNLESAREYRELSEMELPVVGGEKAE